MDLYFLFDCIVDQILEGKTDHNLIRGIMYLRKKARKADRQEFSPWISDVFYNLAMINYEAGSGKPIAYLEPFIEDIYGYSRFGQASAIPFFIMLYGKGNNANLRSNILRTIEYYYISDGSENILAMYHMIRNRYYEGIASMLDRESLFGNMNSMSKLMGIAVRARDTQCLKLFAERGFVFSQTDLDYLIKRCGSYVNEQVIPLMKKYDTMEVKGNDE